MIKPEFKYKSIGYFNTARPFVPAAICCEFRPKICRPRNWVNIVLGQSTQIGRCFSVLKYFFAVSSVPVVPERLRDNVIPFNNLKPLHMLLQDELNTAVQRVLQSGWFILVPEVEALEK